MSNRSAFLESIETQLYTAVVADSLDEVGYRNQAMAEYIRPLFPSAVFAGWARTVTCMDLYHVSDDPYGLEIEAIDSVQPDEVVVVAAGNSRRNAPWGELLSTAAKARGARGAVIDGLTRDVRKIEALGFPVFASGIKPVDSRGRGVVIDYNAPVECAGVLVQPGDLVFGDYDGVVAVPQAVAKDVIAAALAKVTRENSSRDELARGVLLRDVYRKFGVL